jgi:integrase
MRLALACGARRGELLALRWTDVDFDAATIAIRASISQTRAGFFEKPTKTDHIRTVALSSHGVEALRRQRSAQAQERLASGGSSTLAMSFNVPWAALSDRVAQVKRSAVARKAGISTERLHALRHTAASWLIASGVDVHTNASVLGHSSGNVTLGIYSHLAAGMQQSAVANIDARLDTGTAGNSDGHRTATGDQIGPKPKAIGGKAR